ncbi:MAG: hypothetical protein MK207_11940 [Saprospiraceae bacterium]|nr:hypothetical protein [Saprospiraceae bacterium]
MKKLIILYSWLFILVVNFNSCAPKQNISTFYSYETECMGLDSDNEPILKSWGKGNDRASAIEQAKKNAVKDVMFKGINKGQPSCNVKPLILSVNAQDKYEDYFMAFFSKNGPYTKFITKIDASAKNTQTAGGQVVYCLTLSILRKDLKEKLLKDQIH